MLSSYLGEFGKYRPQDARQTLARRLGVAEQAGAGVKGATQQKFAPGGVPPAGGSAAVRPIRTSFQTGQTDIETTPLAAGTPNINGMASGNAPATGVMPSDSLSSPAVDFNRGKIAGAPGGPVALPASGANFTDAADALLLKAMDPLYFADPMKSTGTKSIGPIPGIPRRRSIATVPLPPIAGNPNMSQARDDAWAAARSMAPTRSVDQSRWAEKGFAETNPFEIRNPHQAAKEFKPTMGGRILGGAMGILSFNPIQAMQGFMGTPQRQQEFQRVLAENDQRKGMLDTAMGLDKAVAEDENNQRIRQQAELDTQLRGEQLENTMEYQEWKKRFDEAQEAREREKMEWEQQWKPVDSAASLVNAGLPLPRQVADPLGVRAGWTKPQKPGDPWDPWKDFMRDQKGRALGIRMTPEGPRQVLLPGDTAYVKPSGGGGTAKITQLPAEVLKKQIRTELIEKRKPALMKEAREEAMRNAQTKADEENRRRSFWENKVKPAEPDQETINTIYEAILEQELKDPSFEREIDDMYVSRYLENLQERGKTAPTFAQQGKPKASRARR